MKAVKVIGAWAAVILSIVTGASLGVVLGIIGTIHLWKAMIEWGL